MEFEGVSIPGVLSVVRDGYFFDAVHVMVECRDDVK